MNIFLKDRSFSESYDAIVYFIQKKIILEVIAILNLHDNFQIFKALFFIYLVTFDIELPNPYRKYLMSLDNINFL